MVMPSPPMVTHEKLFSFLYRLLGDFVEELDLGVVLGSRTAAELEPNNVPEPDILFVTKDRAGIIQEKGVIGAPDLVIEILSASTVRNDRGPKFAAYERAGVRELWLIDPYGPTGTEFYQLAGNRFQPVAPDAENILHSSTVAGFWIDVNWLWPAEQFVSVRGALTQIMDG
ncbi:MAG: Uma2 family endonuclease [Caldilineaceae bacterium]|nr:Uma2 family endonuclease [Caldilineaceae bacterium]